MHEDVEKPAVDDPRVPRRYGHVSERGYIVIAEFVRGSVGTRPVKENGMGARIADQCGAQVVQ